MGACVAKVVPRSKAPVVTNDYDMSTVHPAQLTKEFVFGLQAPAKTNLEAVGSSPFYSLRALHSKSHSVHRTEDGKIDGLIVKYSTEKGHRETGHAGAPGGKNMTFSIGAGEHISRVMVGFGEEVAEAIEFHTTLHKHALGDIYDSLYIADVDFSQLDVAIVGFSASFSSLSLCELSVYFAPITAKASKVPLVAYSLEDTSPAKVPELYYQSKRQERELQRDRVVIKDCFSHTRILRRAVTDHSP